MSPAIDPASLTASLASAGRTDVTVHGVSRLTGGSSQEIWAVEASVDGRDRPMVLRRASPGEAEAGAARWEAGVMSAARAAGVPVPEIHAVLDHENVSGILMDRVDGETVPRRILREPELESARSGLTDELGAVLGRLHAMAPPEGLATESRLDSYRATLDALGQHRPVLELVYRWLVDNRPDDRPDVVVHGDFRLGNVVIGPDGLRTVLDWESAHLGDPLEDLGWLCVPAWRFRGPGVVAGIGDTDRLLAAYRRHAPVAVDARDLRWGIILGTWVWAVGCLEQAERHRSGAQRSVDLATVGRRVVENEADLIDMMIVESGRAEPWRLPDPPRADDHDPDVFTYGPPSAAELLEAVRESLSDEVLPDAEGRARYVLRVCVNAIGIVERQLGHRLDDPDTTDEDLVRRVRESPDGDLAGLLEALARRTLDRLLVVAPTRAEQFSADHFQ